MKRNLVQNCHVCSYCNSCVCVWVAQLCPALCDSVDCSPPGSSVLGIIQSRILEWVAIPFSNSNSYTLIKKKWCKIALQFVLVSAVKWSDSPVCVHIPLPLGLLSHPLSHLSRSSQSTELPVLYGRFPLAIYFTHGKIDVSPNLPIQNCVSIFPSLLQVVWINNFFFFFFYFREKKGDLTHIFLSFPFPNLHILYLQVSLAMIPCNNAAQII